MNTSRSEGEDTSLALAEQPTSEGHWFPNTDSGPLCGSRTDSLGSQQELKRSGTTALEDPDADVGQSVPSDCTSADGATPETPRKKPGSRTGSLVASAGPFLPTVCIICKNASKYIRARGQWQRDRLSQARMSSAVKAVNNSRPKWVKGLLLKAAEMKEDSTMLLHIKDKDCAALEMQYHRTCYKLYTRFLSKSAATNTATTDEEVSQLDSLPSGTEATTESTEGLQMKTRSSALRTTGLRQAIDEKYKAISTAQERSPSLLPEEPEPPHIKEEQEEFLHSLEVPEGSMLVLRSVKREDEDEDISSHWSAVKIQWEETGGGDMSLSPVTSNGPAAKSQHPQRDEASTSLLADMNPAAVVLHNLPLNMVHQALHPPAPLQPCSSDEEENVDHSDDSGNDSDWSYSKSLSNNKRKKKKKKGRKLNKDVTSTTQTSQVSSNNMRKEKKKGVRPQSSHSQTFSCSFSECPLAFTSQVLLYRHIKRSHNDLYWRMVRDGQITPASFQQIPDPITSQKQGDTDTQGDTGSLTSQRRGDTDTPEANTPTDSLNHTEKKAHMCDQCGKHFINLETHMRLHIGHRPFQCNRCEKSFSQAGELKTHQRMHMKEKPYHCKLCDKSFTQSGTLTAHLRLHTGERPFSCKYCGKSFNITGHLSTHLRLHTGEKPYHCEVPHCNMRFVTLAALKSHQRVHTGEKPYHCKRCDKSFSYSNSLKKHHHRIHTGEKPFPCTQCDESFKSSYDLKRHQRVHTGEKPYYCNQCDKRFSQPSTLRKHQRVHTGEKPFQCKYCDKSFRNSSSVKSHQKKKHATVNKVTE